MLTSMPACLNLMIIIPIFPTINDWLIINLRIETENYYSEIIVGVCNNSQCISHILLHSYRLYHSLNDCQYRSCTVYTVVYCSTLEIRKLCFVCTALMNKQVISLCRVCTKKRPPIVQHNLVLRKCFLIIDFLAFLWFLRSSSAGRSEVIECVGVDEIDQ